MESEKNYTLFVSPLAAEQIKKQLTKRGTPEGFLRLGISGSGGCNGYKYVIQFEDNSLRERDLTFELEGVHIVVDKKSIIYLNGCTLDWKKSLLAQGFIFNNPNARTHCGCGTSFSV